ncbi:MAG TPA: NAD(P)-dependent oxidoreductase, partial [Myxococcota bacterium]|nr:NAD(P)-dependent oxidoreductase [Myxococcota bacterium]
MDEATRGYPTDKRVFNWSDATTDWRYAKTKALSEQIAWERAKAHGLLLTTVRPGPVYGSRDPKATRQLVEGLLGKSVKAAPTVGVPWVHAGDVANAVVAAVSRPETAGKAYNLAGEPVSQWRFLKAMKRVLAEVKPSAKLPVLVPVPVPVWVRYDASAARRELGFDARPINDGLREALEEYRERSTPLSEMSR